MDELHHSIQEMMKETLAKAGLTKTRDMLLMNTELHLKIKVLLSQLKHSELMLKFLSGWSLSVTECNPLTQEEEEDVKSAQKCMNQGRQKSVKSILQFIITNKPITTVTLLEDNDKFDFKDECL